MIIEKVDCVESRVGVKKVREWNWNLTKCRAKYREHREANYTFYIVDYCECPWPMYSKDAIGKVPLHITELRNMESIKTRYFLDVGKASMFIFTEGGRIPLSEALDEAYVRSWSKFRIQALKEFFEE